MNKICGTALYFLPLFQDGLEISMWKRLTEAFQACSNLPPTKVKTVCDVLLLSAMPNKTTILDHTKLQSLSDLVCVILLCFLFPPLDF